MAEAESESALRRQLEEARAAATAARGDADLAETFTRMARAELAALREALAEARQKVTKAEAHGQATTAELAALRASRSWRITAPLRWVMAKLRR